ncbi:hypothetical protein FSPOR_5106 [Fusarium sporotrichioides]|uniref:Uncharacterized protein n=1 Tax=Fusarium sporotrichioides TaxID=5514 RepID=A0A395S998_FUSSP|nr:hypothetical protein FSPOR_5106 [Fusarium sporotrichioides]
MESLEDFELFAHNVWTRDRLHVGLVNIATCEVDDGFHWVWGRDNALAKQTLLRIERFTLLNRYWKQEWLFTRRVDITPLLSNPVYRACPVFGDAIDFERLLYDPRLCKEHLKQTYRGPMDPRNEFHAWFTVLELLGIKHDHKVDYRYGMCHGEGEYSKDRFEQNRDAAAEWIRKDEWHFQSSLQRTWKINRLHYPPPESQDLEKVPQQAMGFWLFPLESLEPVDDPAL